jgi:ABC-2 type transport system ATP-binding protein
MSTTIPPAAPDDLQAVTQRGIAATQGPDEGPVLWARDLSKYFGQVKALDRATLSVPAGCTGLLGPNGAGKSTFIRVALGLLTSDGGEARVAGFDPRRDPLALRAMVGYMPEHDCLPNDWLAQDFVRYMAELHGLPRRAAIGRANDTLYHVGLGEERFRAIGGFSTGMKQRVKLAQALVHDPHLLLLDEPTNGLDPAGRDEMLALIDRIAHEMGITVLLSSHLLADVERVADHVVMISGGRVLVQGALHELMASTPVVVVRTHGPILPLACALQQRGYQVEAADRELQMACEDDVAYDAIRDAAVETASALVHMKRRVLSLEDVYLAGAETDGQQEMKALVPA